MRFTVLILCLMSGVSNASSYLFASSLAINTADWLQTREISKSDIFYETNPILGKKPNSKNINLYFLSTTVLIIAVNKLLPRKISRVINVGYIFLESVYVFGNYSIGIKFRI